MRVRYTHRAARQLAAILDYIEDCSPQGAQKVMDRIEDALDLLAEYPNSGQATAQGEMRRVIANPYPYVIFYRVTATEVVIHGVRHAARR